MALTVNYFISSPKPRAIRARYLEEVSRFVKRIEMGCGQMNVDYVPLSTKTGFDLALAHYLAHRRNRV